MSVQQTSLPVIQVDEAHFAYERGDGSHSLQYSVPAGPGVLVVANGYKFDDPPGLGQTPPNAIRIIMANGQSFQRTWQGQDYFHELSAATLNASRSDSPFTGFMAGDSAMILIGVYQPGEEMGKGEKMSVGWIGLLNIA